MGMRGPVVGRLFQDRPLAGVLSELIHITIKKVGPGMIVFDGFLDGEEDIVISLPKSVTSKAKAGWSVTMEIARIKGKWRILGIGNVYP